MTPRHYRDRIGSSRRNDIVLYDEDDEVPYIHRSHYDGDGDPYVIPPQRPRYEVRTLLDDQAYDEEERAREEHIALREARLATDERAARVWRARAEYYRIGHYPDETQNDLSGVRLRSGDRNRGGEVL